MQLEQILDGIDKAKITKQTDHLIALCNETAKNTLNAGGIFKNDFLDRLKNINSRINAIQNTNNLQSKL